jgi:hypothetical protein
MKKVRAVKSWKYPLPVVQNVFPFVILQHNYQNTKNCNFAYCFTWVINSVPNIWGGTQGKSIWEQSWGIYVCLRGNKKQEAGKNYTLISQFLFLTNYYSWFEIVWSVVTCHWMYGPGIKSRWKQDFSHLSRLALGPNHPPIQQVLGLSSRGKAAEAWH